MRAWPGRSASIVIAIASLAACGPSTGLATFTADYPPMASGGDPVTVALIDQTGIVAGIAVAPEGALDADVNAVAGQPGVLRLRWSAGECVDRAAMVLNAVGAGYELAIHNHEGIAAVGCTALVVPRAIDITFNRQLQPEQLTTRVAYP